MKEGRRRELKFPGSWWIFIWPRTTLSTTLKSVEIPSWNILIWLRDSQLDRESHHGWLVWPAASARWLEGESEGYSAPTISALISSLLSTSCQQSRDRRYKAGTSLGQSCLAGGWFRSRSQATPAVLLTCWSSPRNPLIIYNSTPCCNTSAHFSHLTSHHIQLSDNI